MRSSGTVLDHKLGKDSLQMLRDGPDFGGENDGDFGVALALADPEQHFSFPVG